MNWEIGINIYPRLYVKWGFASGSDGKESACNMGDLGLIPGLRRSPEEGNGNPLQFKTRHFSKIAWPKNPNLNKSIFQKKYNSKDT